MTPKRKRGIPGPFKELVGKPCWSVKWDVDLGFELNFGAPHLEVREPHESAAPNASARRAASYRQIVVRGQWWLWSLGGNWRVTQRDAMPVTGSTPWPRMCRSLCDLDGQKLTSGSINRRTGATELRFDLGGVVEMWGSKFPDRQIWSLYGPSRQIITVSTDGSIAR